MNRRTFISSVAAAVVGAFVLPWPTKSEGPAYLDCETLGLHGPIRGTFTCTLWRDGKVIREWSFDNPIRSDGIDYIVFTYIKEDEARISAGELI